jgi:predicted ATPase
MANLHITSVQFSHYKAFNSFVINLHEFNVLVGPNNSGKSTIVGAFRILHEGLRKARSKSPERIQLNDMIILGYKLNIDDLPVAAENIFHNYDDSNTATVTFKLSNKNTLKLYFPEQGTCIMVAESMSGQIRSPRDFRLAFDVEVGFVPILGPVDQKEPLYAKEAARKALMTTGASRNFRNIWFHYPDDFDRFRELVQSTWPGMDIERPEISEDARQLLMFCPEDRYPREVCWSGYGFQVWCQMLTFIVKATGASLLVIDEPDIYLHSDLQRQLVALLRDLGPDILLATHSTEIISECEPTSLLTINKRKSSASRVRNASQLKGIFTALGSSLNPTLTQIAKTRRVVFVDRLDFQLISTLARACGMQRLANRSDFAIIQTDGLYPQQAIDLLAGIEKTVGAKVLGAVILNRDYRSEEELTLVKNDLISLGLRVHVHERNEIENYLLDAIALQAALMGRLREWTRRSGETAKDAPDLKSYLAVCMERFREEAQTEMLARFTAFTVRSGTALDYASIAAKFTSEFERRWSEPGGPEAMVPGKKVLSNLSSLLQDELGVTVTDIQVCSQLKQESVPTDVKALLKMLDALSKSDPPDAQ